MKRRPYWCPKPILWELNSILMQKKLSFVSINLHRCWPREWKHSIGRSSNDDGASKRTAKKAIGLDWQNNNFARESRFFYITFLCRRCTPATWNCLITRFVEDVNTRKQAFLSFPLLWYSPLEFNSRKICQHFISAKKFKAARRHFLMTFS